MVGDTARGGGGEATRALRAGEDVTMARGRWASESGGESVAREAVARELVARALAKATMREGCTLAIEQCQWWWRQRRRQGREGAGAVDGDEGCDDEGGGEGGGGEGGSGSGGNEGSNDGGDGCEVVATNERRWAAVARLDGGDWRWRVATARLRPRREGCDGGA
jgi:hypothetical protein